MPAISRHTSAENQNRGRLKKFGDEKHVFNTSSEEQEEVAEEQSQAKQQRHGEESSTSVGHIKAEEEEGTAETLSLDALEVYGKKEEN
ncbi:hypothetical protein EG329_011930 [Mollisiaceae sp. DMI_Dod_QoI]|nr:hypothetical protein EG329_011930 [Helotiales sp. DMI_Dod_QoI]